MNRGPYRHSVWIDVLGVMFAGAVLLGGAGCLLYYAGGAVNDSSSNFSRGSGSAFPIQGHRSARPSRSSGGGTARGEAANPLLSSRLNSAPSGARTSGAASGGGAPFSKSWRSNATPSLTGPPASSGNASPGRAGTASSRADGFSSALPRTSGRSGGRGAQSGGANASSRSGWRAEAQRLGGQARALSNQIGQLDRASEQEKQASANDPESGEGRTASASRSGQSVPEPPSVPIDDHLHWLLVAGVLWGAWRLWGGG